METLPRNGLMYSFHFLSQCSFYFNASQRSTVSATKYLGCWLEVDLPVLYQWSISISPENRGQL